MPGVYAHALFGKKVYKALTGECQKTIDKYKKYYIIGLQGPDILFFHRPFYFNAVNKTGIRVHHEHVSRFIEHAVDVIDDYGIDSPECAYVLGFICHFMLDSACHPFVLQEIERTGIDHISIETEFEAELMRSGGKNPYDYDLRRLLPYDKEMAYPISHVYKNISAGRVMEAISVMRLGKYLLTYRGSIVNRIIMIFLKFSGLYRLVFPHMLYPEKKLDTSVSNKELDRILNGTVKETSDILLEFYNKRENNNPRFDMDFYGKE